MSHMHFENIEGSYDNDMSHMQKSYDNDMSHMHFENII